MDVYIIWRICANLYPCQTLIYSEASESPDTKDHWCMQNGWYNIKCFFISASWVWIMECLNKEGHGICCVYTKIYKQCVRWCLTSSNTRKAACYVVQ